MDEVRILSQMTRKPDMDVYSGILAYKGCTVTVVVAGHSLKELMRDCDCDADRVAKEAVKWIGVEEGETNKALQLPEDLSWRRDQFVKHVKSVLGEEKKKHP